MERKFTPGPWALRKTFEKPIKIIDEDGNRAWLSNEFSVYSELDDRIICTVEYMTDTINQGYGRNETIEKWEANAKLISSAPEMLEQLECCKEYLEKINLDQVGKNVLSWACDTIKKATV